MKQARIAETEKYAHVTFFFNGGVEEPNKGEDRILVNSPKVATYDLKPEMSAYEVCDKLVEAIKADKYDVIIVNFANPDMVGHTGVEPAAIKAIEAVDECIGKAVDALLSVDGTMFICADREMHEHTNISCVFELLNPAVSYTLEVVAYGTYKETYNVSSGGFFGQTQTITVSTDVLSQPDLAICQD